MEEGSSSRGLKMLSSMHILPEVITNHLFSYVRKHTVKKSGTDLHYVGSQSLGR